MIKAAILGAGFVAQLHALAYARDPGVKLCAVCDASLPLAQKLAQDTAWPPMRTPGPCWGGAARCGIGLPSLLPA